MSSVPPGSGSSPGSLAGAPLARIGGVLFRWRSFTPVAVLLVAVPLLWQSRGVGGGPAWTLAGLVLCAAGQALRAWTIGQVPDGTSGQDDHLKASALNTSGPYAHTRNPLYLGNLGIQLGICVVAHDLRVLALVAVFFFLQYAAIIAAEESFLRSQFGAQFDAFCARVPRFWPRLAVPREPALTQTLKPWSLQRALRKEHNPAAAWLLLFILLLGADRAAAAHRAGAAASDTLAGLGLVPYLAAAAAVLIVYLGIKGWKHRWWSGGFTDDLRRRARETPRSR